MRVTRLSTTPVKGLALHHPISIRVDETGAVGDRLFYLADERPSLVSIAKGGALLGARAEYDAATGRLALREGDNVLAEDEVRLGAEVDTVFFTFRIAPGRVVEGPFSEILSERAGRTLQLVKATDTLRPHDVEPLTLLGEGSIDRLSEVAGAPVDSRRFRMLIEFDGGPPHVEDTWEGSRIQIGDATLVGGGPVLDAQTAGGSPRPGSFRSSGVPRKQRIPDSEPASTSDSQQRNQHDRGMSGASCPALLEFAPRPLRGS